MHYFNSDSLCRVVHNLSVNIKILLGGFESRKVLLSWSLLLEKLLQGGHRLSESDSLCRVVHNLSVNIKILLGGFESKTGEQFFFFFVSLYGLLEPGKWLHPSRAQEVHVAIHDGLAKNVSADVASKTRIIYGGL
ncbi:hypothetical protein QVD17_00097 [Tagetes erecta]|uniref:Uncharacterized protein n=1 Tax=Tagetes erecta TaxID=13708 RepID=A0AAD8P5J3_TARER|nr:hypothetical protein QVD17_00097 [Tagetes erecta]